MEKENWFEKEYDRTQALKKQMREEKGIKDLLNLKKGENNITLDLSEPSRFVTTKYGDRYVFALKEPQNLNFMCSVVLYTQILEWVKLSKSNTIKLLRSGEGKETKIEIIQ